MIEFGKITGTVENNRIQVRMRTGECLYAPMAIVGTDVALPSEKWIKDNKDNFLALVTFEKNIYISPMIIGFYPVKGADSSEYNTMERMLEMLLKLVEQLLKAKVNTQIGPQPFMTDTIRVFNEIKDEINSIKDLILTVKL